MPADDETVTIAEAAERLGVTERTLQYLAGLDASPAEIRLEAAEGDAWLVEAV